MQHFPVYNFMLFCHVKSHWNKLRLVAVRGKNMKSKKYENLSGPLYSEYELSKRSDAKR